MGLFRTCKGILLTTFEAFVSALSLEYTKQQAQQNLCVGNVPSRAVVHVTHAVLTVLSMIVCCL